MNAQNPRSLGEVAGGEGEAGETVGEGEDSEGGVIAEAGEASHQGNLLVVKAKVLNASKTYDLFCSFCF